MSWISVATGLAMICLALLVNMFEEGIANQAETYPHRTLYGMGLCFTISGLLMFPNASVIIDRQRFGIVSVVLASAWLITSSWHPASPPVSALWPILFIMSLTICLLATFTHRKAEKILAVIGLSLLTVYFFCCQHWVSVGLILDKRFRMPLDFIGLVAWSSAIWAGIGLFKRVSHPLESTETPEP
jgi:hypothetical protein